MDPTSCVAVSLPDLRDALSSVSLVFLVEAWVVAFLTMVLSAYAVDLFKWCVSVYRWVRAGRPSQWP